MTDIPRRTAPIEPAASYAYFDKIQFWVLNPLHSKTIASLGKQCGRGDIHVVNRPARFSAQYRQRIELRQSSDEALAWLAGHDDVLINRVEIAIDFVFKSWAARDDFWRFLHRHSARRWHGKNQEIRIVGSDSDAGDDAVGTRYDAGRSAPNGIVFYPTKHSRVTGEVDCLHLEWRSKGLASVRRVGINSGRDLIEFNHRQFWQKHLLLYDVDIERLGRLNRNRVKGKRSRANQTAARINRRTGEVIRRSYFTVQELIDRQKQYYRVHRALSPISIGFLLPE